MARPARPEQTKSARSSRQLSRFCYLINPDKVFGTHSKQVQHPVRRQVRLVIWSEEFEQCGGRQCRGIEADGERDDKTKNDVGDARGENDPRSRERLRPCSSAQRRPG